MKIIILPLFFNTDRNKVKICRKFDEVRNKYDMSAEDFENGMDYFELNF